MPTFDTPESIVATVDIAAGHVRISASDRTDTVVEVRPTIETAERDVQAADQTSVEYAHGELVVKAWADIRSEGRIGDSTFVTAAGSVTLDETGRLKLRTAAGNVSVARSVGHTDVSTSSGKVRIGEIDGTAVVATSNGDITLGEVTGDVRLNTANGDITVDRALATVAAKTAFGSVRVGEVVRGSVVLETSFGEVAVGVREGTAAWLDVSSSSGSVRSHLDAAEAPGPSDETVEVRARTGYGDIVIRRVEPAR